MILHCFLYGVVSLAFRCAVFLHHVFVFAFLSLFLSVVAFGRSSCIHSRVCITRYIYIYVFHLFGYCLTYVVYVFLLFGDFFT